MKLTSQAFSHNGFIPDRHTCDDVDVSPALVWSGLPMGTRSLVMIMDDPDAPGGTWTHWVLYNIPPDILGLPEGLTEDDLPRGALHGENDWRHSSYNGPCPPRGRHSYHFKLYALDAVLPDLNYPDKEQLEAAMHGHILAHTELVGRYQRPL